MSGDVVLTHGRVATMQGALIDDGAVVITGDRITWVGSSGDRPSAASSGGSANVIDLEGRLVTPGLVDCHTHIVFGGDRVDEFERRLAGESYDAIHRSGGGIASTVAATRRATDDELLATAADRARQLKAHGATTIEIKSGYGLDVETELRMLRIARQVEQIAGLRVHVTFLGAHTVPAEFRDEPDRYVDLVCDDMLPAVAREGLADSVDAFCDTIAFDRGQTERILRRAKDLGLPVRVHADQLSAIGGAELAASLGALSADHLEHASRVGLRAMADAGVVAVLIPGPSLIDADAPRPNVSVMRDVGVRMAVATDANPGTSPLLSLPLAMTVACTRFGLTVDEAWQGATTNAAAALGSAGGVIAPGVPADLAIWNATRPAEVIYWMGADLCDRVVIGGVVQ
jgi:imidazolonepropionase